MASRTSVRDEVSDEPPSKKMKLLDSDNDSSDDESESSRQGGVRLVESSFKINEEYARRFDHNKKREELQRLEEKFGKNGALEHSDEDESSDDSTSEEEDEDGILATQTVDKEIEDTLAAIRTHDPRVYDKNAKFFSEVSEEAEGSASLPSKQEKPMYLNDYHRKNLLSGEFSEQKELQQPKTYAQEQDELRANIISGIRHAEKEDESESDAEFITRKANVGDVVAQPGPKISELDVTNADRDPDTFLSNFLSSRAWIPSTKSGHLPLEEDNEDDERRADEFEEAYNFRFENPNTRNEKILTHSREAVAKFSVRREDPSGRKKTREVEKARKEAEKRKRNEEKARLRKLKIEELESKINQIKSTSGLGWDDLQNEDWEKILEEGWDSDKWEVDMKKRFNEDYYNEKEEVVGSEGDDNTHKKRKLKKPEWDDDIDITDLVPEFDSQNQKLSLSDIEAEPNVDESSEAPTKKRSHKSLESQKSVRKQHQDVEKLVDVHMAMNSVGESSKETETFRYRQTSPTSFGLTARDILLASDSQLNEFVGLKKLAPFRDQERRQRDERKLGKKARLRKWRKDTFGNEEGPDPSKGIFDGLVDETRVENWNDNDKDAQDSNVNIRDGKRKHRRHKKSKTASTTN